MSAFKRLREFVEGEDAKADDVEVEFDNIFSALHGGITKDNLAPGYMPKAGAWAAGAVEITSFGGYQATLLEETFELAATSYVLINFDATFRLHNLGYNEQQAIVSLYVDGVLNSEGGRAGGYAGANGVVHIDSISSTWIAVLGPGTHSLRLKGQILAGSSLESQLCEYSHLSYLSVPFS